MDSEGTAHAAAPGGTGPARPPAPDSPRGLRREQLLDAADAAIREQGPDVAMDAVAARAGVTKPILYRHFTDRNGLMVAVTRRHADQLVAHLREALAGTRDPRERIRVTIEEFLAFLERDPDLHGATLRLDGVTTGPRHVLAEAEQTLSAEVAASIRTELAGAGLDPAPADTYGTAIVGMVQAVAGRWLDAHDVGRAELADRLTELLWGGFAGIVRRGTGPS